MRISCLQFSQIKFSKRLGLMPPQNQIDTLIYSICQTNSCSMEQKYFFHLVLKKIKQMGDFSNKIALLKELFRTLDGKKLMSIFFKKFLTIKLAGI